MHKMRVLIEQRWEPSDFSQVLESVEGLYYKVIFIHQLDHYFDTIFFDPPRGIYFSIDNHFDIVNKFLLERSRYISSGEGRMHIDSIIYTSPGGIDFVGIGKACESIAGIINNLVNFFVDRPLRREQHEQARLETEKKKIEVEKEKITLRSLQIDNAFKLLDLASRMQERESLGWDKYAERLVPLIVREQELISSRIAEGKVVSAYMSDKSDRNRRRQ